MAEVLITLTIVGVIAALTIPNLMHKYEAKQLETGFKKAYSEINQIISQMRQETGEYNLTIAYKDSNEFSDEFFSHLKVQKRYAKSSDCNYSKCKWQYKDYSKTTVGGDYTNGYFMGLSGGAITDDGMAFEGIPCSDGHNCWLWVDINGKKGPNATGHDIFAFSINKHTGNLTARRPGEYCSKNTPNNRNGDACVDFALKNICPDDTTKTYWECLPK